MSTGQIIKKLRESHGMSQEDLAKRLGYKTKSAVSKIESGMRDVSQSTISDLSRIFNVSPSYILGFTDSPSRSSFPTTEEFEKYGLRPITKKRVPLLGNIPCGEPKYADEDIECYVEIGNDVKADFCLRAKGDSMIGARIHDGDLVFIRSTPQVDNGRIAAVIIDDEATLKRVYYYPENNMMILKPENSKYKDLIYLGDQLETVRILGLAVGLWTETF
ncbi:MAG: S24 family peptidase [Eubacteriales bacterium]|nr:S24 family peptidase [Eubacteriales bacterium]